MFNLSPDLSGNIIQTIYLLFSHNYIVFAYFLGLLVSLFINIKNPSRYATFLLLGFALLVFSFEYDKHIVSGLRDQTMLSLITEKPHYTAERWINLVTSNVLPIFFYISGWCFLFLAILIKPKKK